MCVSVSIHTSCTEYAALLGATGSPIFFNSSANNCLSSVSSTDLAGVPSTYMHMNYYVQMYATCT